AYHHLVVGRGGPIAGGAQAGEEEESQGAAEDARDHRRALRIVALDAGGRKPCRLGRPLGYSIGRRDQDERARRPAFTRIAWPRRRPPPRPAVRPTRTSAHIIRRILGNSLHE